VDDIIALIYDYLTMMRITGPLHETFKEIGAINRQAFLFAEKREPSETAVTWATHMATSRTRRHFLSGGLEMSQWDPARIANALSLLTVQRMNVFVRSPVYAGKTDLREHWYQTEYSVVPLDGALVQRCVDICTGVIPRDTHLHAPETNP
jgi:insulysin